MVGRRGSGRGAPAVHRGRQIVTRSERRGGASNEQPEELVGSSDNRMMTRRGLRPSFIRGSRQTTGGSESLRGSPKRTSVQAVLGQPELLEIILDYAIHDENEEKRVKILRSVRQVNKNWLTGVTNVMRQNKEPLFKLTLTKDNSLKGTPFVAAQGKLLDQFVAALGKRIEAPFPTFKLKILEEFFRSENYDSLVACLRQCAQGLVELEMIFPQNGGSLPGILPLVDLPMMQSLVATFTEHKLAQNLPGIGIEKTFAEGTNTVSLIQTLFNGARSLKKFAVPAYDSTTTFPIAFPAPNNFQFLTFSESITNLELECNMTSENLEVLTRNKLPNLLTLTLLLDNVSYTDGIFTKIMNNFSEHLRNLNVDRIVYNGPPRRVNFVRFPVMKQLTRLDLFYYGLELEEDHPQLSDCFPKLKVLSLYDQTPEMLQKWTVKSVESLGVRLIDENKPGRNYGNTLPVNLESMKNVYLSFPNITEVTLRLLSGQEECGLKYLFKEMRQLKILGITVDGSESVNNSDYWDSVFIGAPVSVITALRETGYWESVELKDKEAVPTIRMLTALQTLSLVAFVEPDVGQVDPVPMISDLTFTFALMKMTNLRQLYLFGRFQATEEMTTKWKNMGRCITSSSTLNPEEELK